MKLIIQIFIGICYTMSVFCIGVFFERSVCPFLYHTFHKPVISVVMSTFNRDHALPIAIESILNQTFKDFEFIIIDDGSTDSTWKVIQSYARKDKRIVPLKNEKNKGLIYSLNRGLDQARGKYIARMDDDDKSALFRFERQVWAMEENPEIVVLGTGIMGPTTQPKHYYSYPMIRDPDVVEIDTYLSSGLAHPTIMIRRDFIEKYHIRYDPKYLYAEDTGFYKDVLNNGGKITSISEGLLHLGYINNVTRPDKYYSTQGETFKKVQKDKLAPFFDAPYEILGAFNTDKDKCTILTHMSNKNWKLHILDQDLLDTRKNLFCRKVSLLRHSVKVIHDFWEDHIYVNPKDKTIFRVNVPSEQGKLIREDNQSVTIKWDSYPPEVFQKEKGGTLWRLKKQ